MKSQNGESLKEEGALAVIICALCDALSKVARKSIPSLLIATIVSAATGKKQLLLLLLLHLTAFSIICYFRSLRLFYQFLLKGE